MGRARWIQGRHRTRRVSSDLARHRNPARCSLRPRAPTRRPAGRGTSSILWDCILGRAAYLPAQVQEKGAGPGGLPPRCPLGAHRLHAAAIQLRIRCWSTAIGMLPGLGAAAVPSRARTPPHLLLAGRSGPEAGRAGTGGPVLERCTLPPGPSAGRLRALALERTCPLLLPLGLGHVELVEAAQAAQDRPTQPGPVLSLLRRRSQRLVSHVVLRGAASALVSATRPQSRTWAHTASRTSGM